MCIEYHIYVNMYHVSTQGVDERMINAHYYYYYLIREIKYVACEKAYLKRKVLSWVLNSDRVWRFHRQAGSEFSPGGAMKLKECLPKYLKKLLA